MKRYILLTVLALASCSVEKEEKDLGSDVPKEISGVADGTLSVYCSPYVKALGDGQYLRGVDDPQTVEIKEGVGNFTHAATDLAEAYNYYAVSPAHSSASSGVISGTTKIMLRMFAAQRPTAAAADPNYDYAVATAWNVGRGETVRFQDPEKLSARLDVRISDPSGVLGGRALRSVSVSFGTLEKPLTGIFYVECGKDGSSICGFEKLAGASELTAVYSSALESVSGSYTVHFHALPSTVPAGTEASVKVCTDNASLVFNATVTKDTPVGINGSTVEFAIPTEASAEVKESFFQDFSTLGFTLPSKLRTTDGDEKEWNFSNCMARQAGSGLLPSLKLTHNSTVVLPKVPGKHYTSVRLYAHEDTFCSMSMSATVTSLDQGAEDLIRDFGYFAGGIREGGYLQFDGLDNYASVAFAVSFSDAGSNHNMLVSAIEADLADGEVKPGHLADGVLDYYTLYNEGEDIITVDGLTVNKETWGEATLLSPEEVTYDNLKKYAGVIFIDDPNGISIDLDHGTATTKDISGGNKVIAGRYGGNGKQPNLKIIELRQNKAEEWNFFNVKITSKATTSQYGFARNSSDATCGKLRFINCFLDYSATQISTSNFYLIYTGNSTNGYFSEIMFDNCVVRMLCKGGKSPHLVCNNNKSRNKEDERIYINNTVIYADEMAAGSIAFIGTSASCTTPKLNIVVKNSTVYNIYNTNALVRAGNLASCNVEGNLVFADYSGTTLSTSKMWWLYAGTADDAKYRMVNNRFYRIGAGSNAVWTPVNTSSAVKPFQENNEITDGNPIFAIDYDHGYLPVNTAVLGTDYGATYDTKIFIKHD